MKEKTTHEIKLKLEELVTKAGKGKKTLGMSVQTSYSGPSDNGITPEMALSVIGQMLSISCDDEKFIKDTLKNVGHKIVEGFGGIAGGDSIEDAKEKIEQQVSSTAEDMYEYVINKKGWQDAIFGEEGNLSKLDSTTRKKLCAWAAAALHAIEEVEGSKKGWFNHLEKLFLEEVVGTDIDE